MKKPQAFLSALFQLGQAMETLHETLENRPVDPARSKNFAPYRTTAHHLAKHPDISDLKLKWLDVCLLAVLWFNHAEYGRLGMLSMDLLGTIFGPNFARIKYLGRISKLLSQEILFIEKQILVAQEGGKGEMAYPLRILLEEEIHLHRAFLAPLLGDKFDNTHAQQPYQSNQEMLVDWFTFIELLSRAQNVEFACLHISITGTKYLSTEQLAAQREEQALRNRMRMTPGKYPLLQIVRRHQLEWDEIVILMYLLKCEMDDSPYRNLSSLIQLVSPTYTDRFEKRKILMRGSKLLDSGLIDPESDAELFDAEMMFAIQPEIKAQILMQTAGPADSPVEKLLRESKLFMHYAPRQSLNELILAPELKLLIRTAIKRNTKRVARVLDSWGLFDKGDIHPPSQKSEQGLLILLYGPPGTGKTFAAGAIAKELNREILQTDMSRLKSKWVGENEQNVNRLFRQYARVVEAMTNPPILLLNEADQFLFKRINDPERSVEVMYNSVQAQFLEAFEHFHGVLIATTNLKANLDPAYERRFHFTLEIPKPGPHEREKLWRLHLPDSIPGSRKIDIHDLAEKYDLTGGQISVVVKNATVEAATRKIGNRILNQEDLIKYCEIGFKDSVTKNGNNIGFK